MDIIGPLPRSRSGKKYVLVICDYATKYPEAIPLHSTYASHIAEALMGVFCITTINRIVPNATCSPNQD